MTTASRVLWIVVILSILAGGVAVGVAARARSEAAEELKDMTRRLEGLEKQARNQPVEIHLLKEDRKERAEYARECLVVIAVQNTALNRLVRDMRGGVSSRSDLDLFTDRARDLYIGFRDLLSECPGA